MVQPHLRAWLEVEPPEVEELDPPAWVEHALLAGLRQVEGVDVADLSARSGLDVAATYATPIHALVADGLLADADGRLAATERGLATLDAVTARLLS